MTKVKNNLKKLCSKIPAEPIFDFLETFVSAVFAVILIFTFFIRLAVVDGHSMEKTLYDKDRLVVNHCNYTPKQGDIVAANSQAMNEVLVKRVIAVSNQTVVVDCDKTKVYVDGKELDEPYVSGTVFDREMFSDDYYNEDKKIYEYTVPSGYVFLMGDNRNHSTDSRVFGAVPESDILGQAVFRFYSEQAGVGRLN